MRRSMSCGAYTLSIDCNGEKRRTSADYSRSLPARSRGSRAAAAGGEARCAASAPGALNEEVGEEGRRPPGAPLVGTALVGGAGHVEVCPGEACGELGEEGGRGDRPAVASADVGEVGEVALELLGVLLGERQLPAAVLGAHPGFEQLLH